MFKLETKSINIKSLVNIGTTLSMTGAVFAAFGYAFTANCLWGVGNLFLIRRNWNKDQSQVVLFTLFEVTAIYGVINHFRGVY
jgi:hypothetical protein